MRGQGEKGCLAVLAGLPATHRADDAEFIAAANPQTVAALVTEVQASRTVIAEAHRDENGPGWFWTRTEWADWSNELAMLIPEDDVSEYSNVDGAQESCITDCLRAYVAERAALAAARTGEASDG